MSSYEGKKTLVTGGGRGIGRAIALAFAKQGADVAVAARSLHELDDVAGAVWALGRQGAVLQVDLLDTAEAQRMVGRAAHELGGLHVLVNNTGGIVEVPGAKGPMADAMLEAFDAVHALNAVCGRCRLSAHGTAGRVN
jgi:NAD(P)-dependent dehydrogenase (short-subunit alcohol dehydrogenase family)